MKSLQEKDQNASSYRSPITEQNQLPWKQKGSKTKANKLQVYNN